MKKRFNGKNHIWFSTAFLTLFALSCLFLTVWKDTCLALDGADVAIYNDSIAPADPKTGASRVGAWQDGIAAIRCMLTWMGLSHEEITYNDLNNSAQDLSKLYKVLVFPGGWAPWYNYWISLAGKERIRSFVKNGGAYFGICAGSFFASDRIVSEGIPYDDYFVYNHYNELTGYDLDLFSGIATGPIDGIAPWPTYKMTKINFPNDTEILSSYKKAPFTEAMLYYGGPYFTSDPGTNVKDLGNYEYNGESALVAFTYGSGRVILIGPHPEIEEDSDRDCVTIDGEDEMDDEGSDWELVRYLLKWLTSGTHPSCPELHTWNGESYQLVGSLYSRSHCPESEFFQTLMIHPVVQREGVLSFLIKEIDKEISYVNSLNMFYKYGWEPEEKWSPLPFFSAVHSRDGNIVEALLGKDDNRVSMIPGDEIQVQFGLPPVEGLTGIQFASVASGYYLWSHETWCEVLALGRELHVEPGDVITVRAYINNMSTKALPDNAVVCFTLQDGSNIGTVSAAGLEPGSPRWYSLSRTVPDDFTAGTYTYKASVWIGDSDITWNGIDGH